jgi:hypothetical protein
MIHRAYVCKLAPLLQAYPNLDIVVEVPGSWAAPVGLAANYPPGTPLTAPPAGWNCGADWYYEVHARAMRIEQRAGSAAFTARTRLGGYLSIVPLEDFQGLAAIAGTIPPVSISASLAPNPISNVSLGAEITAFPDPAYGPVIRLRNDIMLYGGEREGDVYFLVSVGLAENKDEDWANLGHA